MFVARGITKRKHRIIFELFFALQVLILGTSSVYSLSQSPSISLNGKHRFSMGDNLQWAFPEFDDTSWRFIEVPGRWRSQGIKPLRGIGWYRIHFEIPGDFKLTKPGVYLGGVGDADEVYINGIKIGGEGKIADEFVLVPYMPRVYRIPEGVLKYNEDNVMAVRVMNVFFDGGIAGPSVILGDYSDLLIEGTKRKRIIELLEIFVFSVTGVFILGIIFLSIKGAREKENLYFLFVLIIYGIYFLIDSLTFYQTGLKNPLLQKLSISLVCIWFVFFFLFMLNYFALNMRKIYKIVMFLYILIAILILIKLSWSIYPIFLIVWMGFIVPSSLGITIDILIMAYRKKRRDINPIVIGTGGLVVGGITGEILLNFNIGLYKWLYLQPWDYGMLFFLGSIMYGIVTKFIHVRERMRLLASKILTAHEEERKRLSRELHDSLGQNLLTIKFNLQQFNQGKKYPELNSIIKDIDESIDELRDILTGLRPAMLSEMGLPMAIRIFSKHLTRKTGVTVDLKISFDGRLPVTVEENLFRIYQEALNNVIKHSNAQRVELSMYKDSRYLVMQIKDNGIGFSKYSNIEDKGIGLSTMAERANLMGGTFRISSSNGAGTTITVEVPVSEKDSGS